MSSGTYKDGVSPKGYVLSDHMLLGSVVATILVIVVTVQIALDTSYWTIVNHIMVWGSLIWYFVLDYFYNFVIGGSYVGSLTMVCFSFNNIVIKMNGKIRYNICIQLIYVYNFRQCLKQRFGSRQSFRVLY